MTRGLMGVAVDVAVFTVQAGRLELLLIRMKRAPFEGRWALPGGRIASGKVRALLPCQPAPLLVIAPKATQAIQRAAAQG